MTPEQKIKATILDRAHSAHAITLPAGAITADNVDELYDANNGDCELQDWAAEIRGGQVETGLECPWSRHYESKAVAAQMLDGSWVGWTYWYGGGKHGEPEAIEWMEEAYDLDCEEKEKLVVVRIFSIKEKS